MCINSGLVDYIRYSIFLDHLLDHTLLNDLPLVYHILDDPLFGEHLFGDPYLMTVIRNDQKRTKTLNWTNQLIHRSKF